MAQLDDESEQIIALLLQCLIIHTDIETDIRQQLAANQELTLRDALLAGNYVSPQLWETFIWGRDLINAETIKSSQFAVAIFDEITGVMPARNSLAIRGWLVDADNAAHHAQ